MSFLTTFYGLYFNHQFFTHYITIFLTDSWGPLWADSMYCINTCPFTYSVTIKSTKYSLFQLHGNFKWIERTCKSLPYRDPLGQTQYLDTLTVPHLDNQLYILLTTTKIGTWVGFLWHSMWNNKNILKVGLNWFNGKVQDWSIEFGLSRTTACLVCSLFFRVEKAHFMYLSNL